MPVITGVDLDCAWSLWVQYDDSEKGTRVKNFNNFLGESLIYVATSDTYNTSTTVENKIKALLGPHRATVIKAWLIRNNVYNSARHA